MPNFAAWNPVTLANYAKDAYIELKANEVVIMQLRKDFKDAMALVRQQLKETK